MPSRPSCLRVAALALALFALFPGTPAGQSGLVNGANHTGAISAAGEVDTYTFSATVGDSIMLAIGEVGPNSAFVPWIRLLRPDMVVADSESGVLAAQIDVTAPQTGTYTVLVASGDVGNDDTGSYTLTLAQTPGAITISGGDEGGAMTNGASHTGTIHVGDLDMWSFDATAGDSIMLGVGEVSGTDFNPWIRLRSPTGQNLGSQANVLAAQIDVAAPVTGSYTVIVATGDVGVDGTGDYTLTLAKSPGAITISGGDEGGLVTNGANHLGTIHVGDLDAWTFDATAGESIMLAIGEVSGTDFNPWIRLRSPAGQNLGSQSNVLAAQIDTFATVTGTYTVIVSTADANLDGTGDYTLTLAKSPGAISISGGDEGGPMTNGSNHLGTVHVGDLDAWTFTATAGESIMLAVGELSGATDFNPWIRLRSPAGQNLGSESNVLAAQIDTVATVTGTFTVIVSTGDANLDGTGGYTLTLAKSPGAITISGGDEGGPMTNGANHTGDIHIGDLDAWTFTATAGEAIMLAVGEVSGTDLNPWIRLRSPTGQNLGSESNVLAAQIDTVATVTGTFTVIVSTADAALDGTGGYTLTLAKSPGASTISGADEGGVLTNGGNHIGTIHVGDLDMWSFHATAGEALSVAIGETGPAQIFTPWIRLRSPTGQNLGTEANVLAAQINTTATVTGTYTVIVSTADAGLDATGTYTLTIANTPRAFTVSPGDQGGAMTGSGDGGTIFIGDLDIWTFVAHEGDPLQVNIAEVGTGFDFSPWIRLRSPTGATLSSQAGALTAQINAVAPLTGIYTVIVGTFDVGADGSGDYSLDVSGISTSMIKNGGFDQGELNWQFYAEPTLAYIVHQVTGGVLEFYRQPPQPNGTSQATAFQHTGVTLPAMAPVVTQFDLANTSSVRKRIAVLVLDADFSDLAVCTFFLEPNAPMRTYRMRSHTTEAWTNAALYFYAASAGSDGGFYQVDNVSMAYDPNEDDDRTDCVDPTTPAPPGGADGPNLLVNGDFQTGLIDPWFTFSFITWQINNGVFEFVRPSSTPPSGVVGQATGQAMVAGQILTATFQLGNSSNVRKRVTAILGDSNFSDLSACTFWVPPGQPLSNYVYRTFTTQPWANALLSIYPSTTDVLQWIQLDNVTVQRTPSAAIVGTECLEPGEVNANNVPGSGAAVASTESGAAASIAAAMTTPGTARRAAGVEGAQVELAAPAPGLFVATMTEAIDLRASGPARLLFDSLLPSASARGLVQVSVDREAWATPADVTASGAWTSFDVDLSAFAGQIVYVRFVLDTRDAQASEPPAVWKLERVRIVR